MLYPPCLRCNTHVQQPWTDAAFWGPHPMRGALPRAGYYGTFMKDVFERMNGQVHITTVASLGFSRSPPSPLPLSTSVGSHHRSPTFTLEQQIDHKAAFLRHVCCKDIDMPIVLIGHSIGFYMALRAARALEQPQGSNSHAKHSVRSARPSATTPDTSNTQTNGTTADGSTNGAHLNRAPSRYALPRRIAARSRRRQVHKCFCCRAPQPESRPTQRGILDLPPTWSCTRTRPSLSSDRVPVTGSMHMSIICYFLGA